MRLNKGHEGRQKESRYHIKSPEEAIKGSMEGVGGARMSLKGTQATEWGLERDLEAVKVGLKAIQGV